MPSSPSTFGQAQRRHPLVFIPVPRRRIAAAGEPPRGREAEKQLEGGRPRGGLRRFPCRRRSALNERLPEQLDVLCRERLGLEHLELGDLAEDAERGLEIGILEDAEILPRAHDREEALDGAALVLDDLVDLLEVLGGLLEVLPRDRRDPEEPDIGEHKNLPPLRGIAKSPIEGVCLATASRASASSPIRTAQNYVCRRASC